MNKRIAASFVLLPIALVILGCEKKPPVAEVAFARHVLAFADFHYTLGNMLATDSLAYLTQQRSEKSRELFSAIPPAIESAPWTAKAKADCENVYSFVGKFSLLAEAGRAHVTRMSQFEDHAAGVRRKVADGDRDFCKQYAPKITEWSLNIRKRVPEKIVAEIKTN